MGFIRISVYGVSRFVVSIKLAACIGFCMYYSWLAVTSSAWHVHKGSHNCDFGSLHRHWLTDYGTETCDGRLWSVATGRPFAPNQLIRPSMYMIHGFSSLERELPRKQESQIQKWKLKTRFSWVCSWVVTKIATLPMLPSTNFSGIQFSTSIFWRGIYNFKKYVDFFK